MASALVGLDQEIFGAEMAAEQAASAAGQPRSTEVVPDAPRSTEVAAEDDFPICEICNMQITDFTTGTKRDQCGHCYHDDCLHATQEQLGMEAYICPKS